MLHDCKYIKSSPEDDLGVRLVAQPNTDILKMTSTGVFESQLPNITKVSKSKPSNTSRSILKIKNETAVDDVCFELVGVNEKSVRGLTVKQVEKLLRRIAGEVRILVRSPDNTVVHLKCSQKLFLCYDGCFIDP